jgi:hypothetical protein
MMDMTLVEKFMQDLKIEAVKLNLQLSSPASEQQKNDVLRSVKAKELDSVNAMTVIRKAISDLESCISITDLHDLFDKWNTARIDIQYTGYGYDPKTKAFRKGEAYAYVFLMRVLKKRHSELYSYMKLAV